ncbi:MAG: pseudaminic acid biosynthesis-associated methylase [Betaproteobacteria bacterium]
MKKRKTDNPQLRLWRGEFGNAYIERNPDAPEDLRRRAALLAPMLRCLAGAPPASILEVGANIGANLKALRGLTGAELYAVEPNAKARARIVAGKVVPKKNVLDGIASDIGLDDGAVDLAFTSGVLIHIHPGDLLASCREIHRIAARYVACAEYFSPRPEEVLYRGNKAAMFRRDFGGFWLDNFADLRLLDYGFTWYRAGGPDDMNWWVFEKR